MKKVVLASFLACAVVASGLPSAFAQDAPAAAPAAAAPAAGAPAAATGQVQMSDAEYAVYNNAQTQTDPKAKAAAFETYLTQFPQSAVKATVLETLMALYASVNDITKTLDAADRLLQVDPTSVKALYVETFFRNGQASALTDAAAKQTAMDTVAGYAQKGLSAPKPTGMADADFDKLKAIYYPVFYSAIGYDGFLKKDPAAIDAYKKEIALVPVDATKTPGTVLQDIYYLGYAYYQSTPPDYLNCTFYMSRAAAYAPEPYKSKFTKDATYCYKKFHGTTDGYDAVVTSATANLNPPDGFAASITPAPTVADQIHTIISTTPDLATLAIEDKETIFQNGSPEDAAKVWDSIKGKSVEIPGALVIASTPAQLQVAVSPDAIASKTADFTFNMKAPEEPKTAAERAAAKKTADAAAAASAVGQTVTLSGTYDSFTPKPLMITMTDGEVVLPKAAKAPVHAPVHHAAAH
jgi:hypothetical protein